MNRLFVRASGFLLAVAALAGCDSIFGSGGDTFTLRAINGAALPVTYDAVNPSSAFDIVAGRLTLDGDRVVESMTLACKDPLPPGVTECGVANGGRFWRRGTWDADEHAIHFEEMSSTTGVPAEVSDDAVVVHYGVYVFEYRR